MMQWNMPVVVYLGFHIVLGSNLPEPEVFNKILKLQGNAGYRLLIDKIPH
jgi:hypothetical protein